MLLLQQPHQIGRAKAFFFCGGELLTNELFFLIRKREFLSSQNETAHLQFNGKMRLIGPPSQQIKKISTNVLLLPVLFDNESPIQAHLRQVTRGQFFIQAHLSNLSFDGRTLLQLQHPLCLYGSFFFNQLTRTDRADGLDTLLFLVLP